MATNAFHAIKRNQATLGLQRYEITLHCKNQVERQCQLRALPHQETAKTLSLGPVGWLSTLFLQFVFGGSLGMS